MIYAISDIHAHTKLFNKFYETLKEDDTVYVLGDVIDKGDGTLDIFKTIIYDGRFTLLLGNHEWFFYKYLTSSGFLKEWYGENWLYRNDGQRTYDNFLSLSSIEQEDIKERLFNLPVILRLRINNQQIYLTHAYCNYLSNLWLNNSKTERYIKDAVWRRGISIVENSVVVSGHTPVQHLHYFENVEINTKAQMCRMENKNVNGVWYDIDCGLAMNDGKGVLGVLNLEDFSEKYFYEEK